MPCGRCLNRRDGIFPHPSAIKRHVLPDPRLGESIRIRYVRTVESIPFWAEKTTTVPFPDEEGHVLFVLRGWPLFTGLSEVAV